MPKPNHHASPGDQPLVSTAVTYVSTEAAPHPREAASDPSEAAAIADVPLLSNAELARVFHEIGDILEVKGERVFKTVAYHKAADAIQHSPIEVAAAYRSGMRPKIEGVGTAISDKLDELARTGRLRFYEGLLAEFPPTRVELLRIPGVGPKTVRLVYDTLGIDNLDDLRKAAESGRLRTVRGLSERTEASILDGIASLEARERRLLLGAAEEIVNDLIGHLTTVSGVNRIEPAGSFRRRRETVGDIDLLAETTDAAALVDAFVRVPEVTEILQRGSHKAAVRIDRGPQVDLMIMPPGTAGTYLIHFTGSKDHNVRLRGRCRERGWSLSEKGFLRIGPDGEPLTGDAAELLTFATEQEAYRFLDLDFIEPELRENRGEIEAAATGQLPKLVTIDDLRGDLHSHSDWSDGVHTIEAMAEAARARGHAYQVLTDHSQSLAIAKGLSPERVRAQARIIAQLNERFAREEDEGRAPSMTPPEGFRLLHGCELEIRADGQLDYDEELLAQFDVVVASVHVGRRQTRDQLTARTLHGIRSKHVDVIAHPAGRMIQTRADLDLEWEVVYAEAARTGTALEMNGSDHRLDLSDERGRRAIEVGCLVALDSDAHRVEEFHDLDWAVSQARRAWVQPENVLNTRSRADLLAWVGAKGERVGALPAPRVT